MNPPTVGVEEELLLVDADTFAPRTDAAEVLALAARDNDDGFETELRVAMVETGSAVCKDLDSLGRQLTTSRARLVSAAASRGARVIASASHPTALARHVPFTDDDRYLRMGEEFGLTAYDSLVCGCHVHVAVPDQEQGVHVIDRVRPWLPVLLALSCNSPLWQGVDSGHASWRTQVWQRWPTAGPTGAFGSVAAYHERTRALIDTGAALDEGMLYYDVRLSRTYPTIEVRVADVCLDPADAVVIAGLVRALTMTALADPAPAPAVPVELLRAADWSASRHGLTGSLVHPLTGQARPAGEVVAALLSHVREALEAAGDLAQVTDGVARIARVGTGAAVQRRALADGGTPAVLRAVAL